MKLENWIIVKGSNGEINKGVLKYISQNNEDKSDENKDNVKGNEVTFKSNVYFSQGEISFKIFLSSIETSFALELNSRDTKGNSNRVRAGFARNAKGFLIQDGNRQSEIRGNLSTLDFSKFIEFSLQAKGSILTLYMNGIEITTLNVSLIESQIELYINSESDVMIKDIVVESQRDKAFVIMQFSSEFNELYENVIKPTCEKYNIECVRADDIYTSTPILSDITESIIKSSMVIADITPDNPNVFYEIGYSHAISKPTILLCERSRENLPFDVSGIRTIFYSNTIAGKRQVEENLDRYIKNMFRTII